MSSAAAICSTPDNRQPNLQCGGPGVGTCVQGTCQCEAPYSSSDCSTCSAEFPQPQPAPEWGPTATFCTASSTPSISVAEIPLPSTVAARSRNDAQVLSRVVVLSVLGTTVIIMATALLYVLHQRLLRRGYFSDGSDVTDVTEKKAKESRQSGSDVRVSVGDSFPVDNSSVPSLVDMDTIISNPLALQTLHTSAVCNRCGACMLVPCRHANRACGGNVPHTLNTVSSSDSVQLSRTPMVQLSADVVVKQSASASACSNSNEASRGLSPAARSITWVAQARDVSPH
jgi:hypothetical protein